MVCVNVSRDVTCFVFSFLQHPVVSNLQTLLRQDSDIADPSLLATHLLKKVEVAVAILPTTPALRGVALEALLSTFKFYFTHRHTLVRFQIVS